MKGLPGLKLIIAITVTLVASKCPDPEIILPCICHHNTSDVYCTGNMTELPVSKLDPAFHWNGLYIQHTNLSIIRNTSLGDTTWNGIYIHNNSNLRYLESNAFKSGPNNTLWIANNTEIRNDDVFAVVKQLKNTERIFLERNVLSSPPSFMFNEESKVKFFRMNNNRIVRIHSNTFTGAKYLEIVMLDHNHIYVIDPKGLDFTSGCERRNVTVILDNNQLNSSSFNVSTFSITDKNIKIKLSLKSNDLINIIEEDFVPFLENGLNELDFDNNDFNCDCGFKWLLEKSIAERVFSVDCVNKYSS